MKVKAGYRTSEFWFTVVSFLFSGLYLLGILKENDQKEELITIVSHAVESTILISGQALILYRYIKGRNEVKKVAEQIQKEPEPQTKDKVVKPEPVPVKIKKITKPKKKPTKAKKKTK